METKITKAQLAKSLSVCPRSINRMMSEKAIPFYRIRGRIIRFDLHEVETALASCRVPAANEPRPPKRHMVRQSAAA